MKRHEFLQKQYELSVLAGTNQRYHQRYATWWWRWDAAIKAITATSAVIGVILSVATAGTSPNPDLVWWSVALSIVTTIAAVSLNVLQFGSWEKDHRDLFRQWSEMREDVDALEHELGPGDPNDKLLCDFRKLAAKVHRICGQESTPNETLVKEFYNAEVKSREYAKPVVVGA